MRPIRDTALRPEEGSRLVERTWAYCSKKKSTELLLFCARQTRITVLLITGPGGERSAEGRRKRRCDSAAVHVPGRPCLDLASGWLSKRRLEYERYRQDASNYRLLHDTGGSDPVRGSHRLGTGHGPAFR